MKHIKYILFLGIYASLFCACREKHLTEAKTGKEGEQMPDFIVQTDSSSFIHTRERITEKATVLFYFSPGCPYCRAQLRSMRAEMKQMEDVKFYMVSNAGLPEIREIQKQYKLTGLNNVVIGRDTGYTIASYYRVSIVPFTAIYKADKTMLSAYRGQMPAGQLRAILSGLKSN